MHLLLIILFFSVVSGVLSLIGGVALLARVHWVNKFSIHFVSFAVGALLAPAFLDLLPEALEMGEGQTQNLLLVALGGIVGFFILESLILKFHPHHHEDDSEIHHHATPTLLLVGDTVHNFIDGAVLAAAFLVNVPLGVVTALAVAAHELPQEISDFSVMIHHGWARKKVFFANFYSSLANVAGALVVFLARGKLEPFLPQLLAVTAGIFIYIAAADLIPEISHEHRRDKSSHVVGLLLLGILAVGVLRYYLE